MKTFKQHHLSEGYKVCGNCDHINSTRHHKCRNCGEKPAWHKPTDDQLTKHLADKKTKDDKLHAAIRSLGFGHLVDE